MKRLLYVCEVDSGGITEYSILQCQALIQAGVSVCFLCKSTFPKNRFSEVVKTIEFEPVEPPLWAFGKVKTLWRMTVGLNRFSQQIQRIAEAEGCESILFSFFKEYFAPFWVKPLVQMKRDGRVMGTIAHDPVRDFVIGPKWWHRFCVRKAFSFLTHVFVHDDTPVDFGGKQPAGIEVHQIPHGPYEVAEPKIGRIEMRKRLGFLTTKFTKGHERGEERGAGGRELGEEEDLTTDCTDEHGYFQKTPAHAEGSCAGASESDSLASELADSPVSESSPRSASGPAGARIAARGIGSVGGNQLADSGEFLEGQSQAGLQIGSQKHPTPRAAMGSDTCGDNSSSVSISVISGEKTSGETEAPSPATSHSSLATPASPDVVFLAFGQIRDGKNLDLFLRAMTRLPENVKLLVAGKGDSGSSRPPEFYQKLAEELGVAARCRWDIRRIPDEEVGDIFAACDVVLVTYSAKFRSASGVLNAAVSARKPVLASSGPGPLKTVVEKYQLGVFVEPDNPEEILRGAQMILDSIAPPAALHPLPDRAPKALALDPQRARQWNAKHIPTGSTLDSAQLLATSTLINPAWDLYEEENSWSLNAKLVAETFFVKTPFAS